MPALHLGIVEIPQNNSIRYAHIANMAVGTIGGTVIIKPHNVVVFLGQIETGRCGGGSLKRPGAAGLSFYGWYLYPLFIFFDRGSIGK